MSYLYYQSLFSNYLTESRTENSSKYFDDDAYDRVIKEIEDNISKTEKSISKNSPKTVKVVKKRRNERVYYE
jgi:predicted secreted protein